MRITWQETKAKSLACQQNFPSRWKFHAPLQNLQVWRAGQSADNFFSITRWHYAPALAPTRHSGATCQIREVGAYV
jgi:uncharacterized membrane protein